MSEEFHPHRNRESFTTVVDRCVNIVKFLDGKIDAIAVRGASGLVVGSVVSYQTGVPLAIIRKEGENPHCYDAISVDPNVLLKPERVVWLDDFISGGSTFEAVIARLHGRPRWVILYYTYNRFMCVREREVGLAPTPYCQYLYENEPTPDMHERFAWPKPQSS